MRAAILLYEGVDEHAAIGLLSALRAPVALDRAPHPWTVETVGAEAMLRGAHGLRLVPDVLGWPRARNADVLLVPGGAGAQELARDADATRVTREHHQEGRWTGAAGEGVLFLGRAGLLRERRVAAARTLRDEAAAFAADVAVGPRVVEDGRVVTSVGGAAGVELGLQLVRHLIDLDTALQSADHLGVKGWAPAAGDRART